MEQPPIYGVAEIAEIASHMEQRKDMTHWPPRSLRGTVRPCWDGASHGWHWEAIGLLPGDLILHVEDPEHYSSVLVARTMLAQFAENLGVTCVYVPHAQFIRSGAPEIEGRA